MINKLTIKNVGCIRDAAVSLTPLHAFIGPNDSGKSTFLRATYGISKLARGTGGPGDLVSAFMLPEPSLAQVPDDGLSIAAQTPHGSYALAVDHGVLTETLLVGEKSRTEERFLNHGSKVLGEREALDVALDLPQPRLIRLDPDGMRSPSGLIRESEALSYLDQRGMGLPGVYFTILSRGDSSFQAIVSDLQRLFPAVRTLRVPAHTTQSVSLEVELRNGSKVPISNFSEGLLYYLAFAAIPHLAGASTLLIEEPENGLHPSRIADVMRVLRALTETDREHPTQVLIATHSPLVINELRPDEVTVVSRPGGGGSVFTPIATTPNFAERSKVYALGELWLSYANGIDEAPLLTPTKGASE